MVSVAASWPPTRDAEPSPTVSPLSVRTRSSGLSARASSTAVRATFRVVGSPAAQVRTRLSPSCPLTPIPATPAASAIAWITAAVKSASSADPLIVTVTDAVFDPVSASPPSVIVKVPWLSLRFSSEITASCVGVSFPAASDVTVIPKVTSASWSTIVSVAAPWPPTSAAVPSSNVSPLSARTRSSGLSIRSSSTAVRSTSSVVGSPSPQVRTRLSPS